MTPRFYDLVIGGVMLPPILRYAGLAILIALVLRPLLGRIGFGHLFANPSLAEFSLFISIVGLLTVVAGGMPWPSQ